MDLERKLRIEQDKIRLREIANKRKNKPSEEEYLSSYIEKYGKYLSIVEAKRESDNLKVKLDQFTNDKIILVDKIKKYEETIKQYQHMVNDLRSKNECIELQNITLQNRVNDHINDMDELIDNHSEKIEDFEYSINKLTAENKHLYEQIHRRDMSILHSDGVMKQNEDFIKKTLTDNQELIIKNTKLLNENKILKEKNYLLTKELEKLTT